MNSWPLQKDCDVYYGNPRGVNGAADGQWERNNLTAITPPFRMTYAGRPISTIKVHRRCALSLLRVLGKIWEAAGRDQKKLDEWGVSIFGGSYNFRLMRGLNTLSMHSYGCAIDLDPARNALFNKHGHFTPDCEVVKAFRSEGWTWGGDWDSDGLTTDERRPDPMHFKRPASSNFSDSSRLAA